MKISSLSASLLLTTFLLLSTFVSATNNITKLLQGSSDYSSFSSALTKYGVASEIDSRNTITVLCPSNSVFDSALASLGSNPSRQTVIDILSYHVLLDYYDLQKIKQITNGSVLVTTLFQTTGLASGNDGFVNITDVRGSPMVGLPTKGSNLTATIGKEITTVPYNISLLTIDSVLVPIGAAAPTKAPSPAPTKAPSPAPASSPTPASSPSSVPTPAVTPTPSAQSPASLSSPTPSSAPSSLSPASSSESPTGSAENSTSFAASVNVNNAFNALLVFLVGVVSIRGL